MPDDDRPFNRRNFFREGMKHLLKPMQHMAAPLEDALKQLSALDFEAEALRRDRSAEPPLAQRLNAAPVRPPGALPEQQFRETCSRCGECVKVCPVRAIRIDPDGLTGAGAPYIDIDQSACVLCDGLLCMNTCPSGALVPTPIGDIDMGTAVWHEQTCLRTHGEGCSICVDQCPIGEVAIVLEGGNVKVIEDGCTGCGVCQNRCPTGPKSITVAPKQGGFTASQPRGRQR